ncbi:DNA cytosine methyltransferase [Streptomyces sp. NPDC101221]|uniref:DNA cytosine methyltransferase n=1 Tax=Streptomyces sp. NPDC101221 TaxID=3366132 RepID=UPI00380101D9
MSPLRIGSLFTGTGALDLAVMDVYDAEVVWHSQYEPPDKNGKEDKNQYAAKILARHWPDVPNLGDITKIDWQGVLDDYGPVDVLTGGFPCQDVSSAGRRVGLNPDSRSGLWNHMAHAISILQPKLVVIENVEGLLSAPAASDMEPCPYCVGDGHAEPVLRACGAVLGDLASLGFDAEWGRYGADEVGAPHRRRRIIIRAWPAALDPGLLGWGDGPRVVGGLGTAGRDAEASADTANLGHERGRSARDGRPGPSDCRLAAADAAGDPRRIGDRDDVQPRGAADGRESAAGRGAVADADGRGREGHQERDGRPVNGQPEREPRLDPVGRGARRETVEGACPTCGCEESFHDAGGFCAGCHGCTDPELGRPDEADADAQGDGRHEGRPEPARQQGRSDAAQPCGAAFADADGERDGEEHQGAHLVYGERQAHGRGAVQLPRPDGDREVGDGGATGEPAGGRGSAAQQQANRRTVLDLREGDADLNWGDYEPAIRRWERVLGRRAPWPTDALGRLSPVFTEWLMGLPDGWVTDTPGLTRTAMLRALGNGVVWQQAAYALRDLHARVAADETKEAA